MDIPSSVPEDCEDFITIIKLNKHFRIVNIFKYQNEDNSEEWDIYMLDHNRFTSFLEAEEHTKLHNYLYCRPDDLS